MGLTRPKINVSTTGNVVLKDPITVLHGGATQANVDIGFLLNRANGGQSNVALYWSETAKSFTGVYTTSTGTTDANISISSYTNFTTGNILPGQHETYNLGSPSSRFNSLFLSGNTIDIGGATIKTDLATGSIIVVPLPTLANPDPTGIVITPNGVITTISSVGGVVNPGDIGTAANALPGTNFANLTVAGDTFIGGNLTVEGTTVFKQTVVEQTTELVLGNEIVGGTLIANSGTQSTSVGTGALQVIGGASVSGNVNIGGNLYANNTYIDRGQDMNDWNTVTKIGVYLVNRSSWTGTENAPYNSLNFSGVLEVINSGNTAIVQNYRPYDDDIAPIVFWTRSKFGANPWSAWVEIIDGAEKIDGGSF